MRKLKNKYKIIFTIIILLFISILLIIINPFLTFKIEKEITLEVDSTYKDEYKAYFFGKDVTDKVKVEGNVDISKLGTYKITYSIKSLLLTKKVNKKVYIVDTKSPIITLKGDNNISICPSKQYEEQGYEAMDNYDKDITNKVTKKNIDNGIQYEVLDSSNNIGTVTRIIKKEDIENPKITLKGGSYTIKTGNIYQEKGFIISDNCDELNDNDVVIEGKVDTNKIGTYKLTYTVKDSSSNTSSITRTIKVSDTKEDWYATIIEGPTYIDGILIVNKKYSIPSAFKSDLSSEANSHLKEMQQAAKQDGNIINTVSGYRSYSAQDNIYNNYVKKYGQASADTFSARPGHSEHQTGLAFDVGQISNNFGNTKAGIWLVNNSYKYGFILRYPKGKENITGYSYEPWHFRYVGIEPATYIMQNNITLEEYLGV